MRCPNTVSALCITSKVLRGHQFMTSTLRGEGGVKDLADFAANSTDRLHEVQTKEGEGV